MNRNIETGFTAKTYFGACAIILFGFISFSAPRSVAAENSTHRATGERPMNARAFEGFELSNMWSVPGGGNASVFFTYLSDEGSQLWHSTKTGQRAVLSAESGQRFIIAGVTKRYVYLHNSYLRSNKRVDLWRMNVNGDASTLRSIKTLSSQNNCYDLEFSRTTDDQFVAVINMHSFAHWEYGDEKICHSSRTRGSFVFRIGDDEDTMTNIGKGLPNQPNRTTYVHSTGVGDIIGNNLFMFTAKHEAFKVRASKTGLYRVALFTPRARGVFQFPPLDGGRTYTIGRSDPEGFFRANHETEVADKYRLPYHLNTVKGASVIYSRIDAKVGSGCELWRFTGTARGATRLAQLNTKYDADDCHPELVKASGNRLIFKNINFRTNSLEIWETRGSPATTKKLYSWTAPAPGLLQSMENDRFSGFDYISLQVIGNRIWFVKRTANNISEIWRSNLLQVGTAVRFGRLWRSQSGSELVRVLKAFNTPLVLIRKSESEATLYRMNQRTRKLTRLISGTGMTSNIVTVDGEAIFAFRKSIASFIRSRRAGLYSLNLRTGNVKIRKMFR